MADGQGQDMVRLWYGTKLYSTSTYSTAAPPGVRSGTRCSRAVRYSTVHTYDLTSRGRGGGFHATTGIETRGEHATNACRPTGTKKNHEQRDDVTAPSVIRAWFHIPHVTGGARSGDQGSGPSNPPAPTDECVSLRVVERVGGWPSATSSKPLPNEHGSVASWDDPHRRPDRHRASDQVVSLGWARPGPCRLGVTVVPLGDHVRL
jgi:hypothetical protein